MRYRVAFVPLLLLLALPLLVVGCKGGKSLTPAITPSNPPPTERAAPPAEPSRNEVTDRGPKSPPIREPDPTDEDLLGRDASGLRTIYFEFDSYDLSPSAMATLREDATWLKSHPGAPVVVEGHCDERGTIEYNLALGEKRAASVREFLVNLGLDRSRLQIKSYGEEHPAVPGHGEDAWSKNRRADFTSTR